MVMKVVINILKKEMVELKSTDITSLWGLMDVPSTIAKSVTLGMRVENEYIVSSPETDKEAPRIDAFLEEYSELIETEEVIIAVVTRPSLKDKSMIGMSGSSGAVEPKLA